MHQCPGCLEYIIIVCAEDNKPPVAYEVGQKGRLHHCDKLAEFREEIKNMPIEEVSDFVDYLDLIKM